MKYSLIPTLKGEHKPSLLMCDKQFKCKFINLHYSQDVKNKSTRGSSFFSIRKWDTHYKDMSSVLGRRFLEVGFVLFSNHPPTTSPLSTHACFPPLLRLIKNIPIFSLWMSQAETQGPYTAQICRFVGNHAWLWCQRGPDGQCLVLEKSLLGSPSLTGFFS